MIISSDCALVPLAGLWIRESAAGEEEAAAAGEEDFVAGSGLQTALTNGASGSSSGTVAATGRT